jgi:hypothetical protein
MTIGPVRQRHCARPGLADERHRGADLLGAADRPVRPAQVDAPRRPEDGRRGVGLRQPLLDGAVAPHLPRGQIAQTDAEPEVHVTRNGAAEPDLDVVGMRPEDEHIHRGLGLFRGHLL